MIVATQSTARIFRASLQQLHTKCRCFGTFSPSIPLKEKIIVKVPTMGDSITEGTIVEWAANVGQAVKEGDVVALVETDKVTIDIKADTDGVIVQHFGEVDGNVEVGANLYEIDTEGKIANNTAEKAMETNLSDSEGVDIPPSTPSPTDVISGNSRIPLIKFLNKDGWYRRKNGLDQASNIPIVDSRPVDPKATVTLDSSGIGAMYGRLPFSEREIDAMLLGGASEAPVMNEW